MAISSINPASQELIQEYNAHTTEEIHKTIHNASEAYNAWKQTSFNDRKMLMLKCATLLDENAEQYGKIITREMGKLKHEAEGEVKKCAYACRYFAEKAAEFLSAEKINVDEGEAKIIFDPLGPTLAIMPWNFPFWQVFRFAVPAIMAGNAVILKPAPNVPGTGIAIEKLFKQAGFPKGVFQNLLIENEQAAQIIEDKRIKGVTLTGSDKAGSHVAAQAGKNLKKTVLELGGSDPFIVFSDADIEKAAKTAAKARMVNGGQSCIAAKRFIVHEDCFERFVNIMYEELAALTPVNPASGQTGFPPMARPDLVQKLHQQVNEIKQAGGKVILGGEPLEDNPNYFWPTIITNMPESSPANKEELFGPVACIYSFTSEEEAIYKANDSEYGLAASIWTNNDDKAQEMAHEINAGCIHINSMVASDPKVPFGGTGRSGMGKELGYLGIREFTFTKSVWKK